MARSQKGLKLMGAAEYMRRFFGSGGGAGRQDVLITEGADGPFVSDRDQEARATCKKGRNMGRVRNVRMAPPNLVGIKCKGVGRL